MEVECGLQSDGQLSRRRLLCVGALMVGSTKLAGCEGAISWATNRELPDSLELPAD